MPDSTDRTDPKLWDKVKTEVTQGSKGGEPNQWSARKAQLAVAEYKKRGGAYKGRKSADNHLVQWTREEWGTKSGQPSGQTHERYLPKAARDTLSSREYTRTTAKKRSDTAKGQQFSQQPADIAAKVSPTRAPYHNPEQQAKAEPTKAQLMQEARKRQIPRRTRMSKEELARTLLQ